MSLSGSADMKGRRSHVQHMGLAFTCICLQDGRQVGVQGQGLNDGVRLEGHWRIGMLLRTLWWKKEVLRKEGNKAV